MSAAVADGCFETFSDWVNCAAASIGGTNALCVDSQERTCSKGGDFMRARDQNTFPIKYFFYKGSQTPAQTNRSVRLAIKADRQRR